MNNVKKWLTGGEETIQAKEIKHDTDFTDCKLIKWNGNHDLNKETQIKLLEFIESGGSLMCAFTAWGHLSSNPHKTIDDVKINYLIILKNFNS